MKDTLEREFFERLQARTLSRGPLERALLDARVSLSRLFHLNGRVWLTLSLSLAPIHIMFMRIKRRCYEWQSMAACRGAWARITIGQFRHLALQTC